MFTTVHRDFDVPTSDLILSATAVAIVDLGTGKVSRYLLDLSGREASLSAGRYESFGTRAEYEAWAQAHRLRESTPSLVSPDGRSVASVLARDGRTLVTATFLLQLPSADPASGDAFWDEPGAPRVRLSISQGRAMQDLALWEPDYCGPQQNAAGETLWNAPAGTARPYWSPAGDVIVWLLEGCNDLKLAVYRLNEPFGTGAVALYAEPSMHGLRSRSE